MPTFIPDSTYDRLLADLRAAALTTDWHSALAEALACADVMPEGCRSDFEAREQVATQSRNCEIENFSGFLPDKFMFLLQKHFNNCRNTGS